MAGKFLEREAVVDLVKSEQAANGLRKRQGLTQHPIRFVVCGCPDPKCGGWHVIETERTIPTGPEAVASLVAEKQIRKASERVRKANVGRKRRKRA